MKGRENMENSNSKCESCGAPLPITPAGDSNGGKCFKCRMASFSNKLETAKAPEPEQKLVVANTFPIPPVNKPPVSPKELPERMKASKTIVGSNCSICQKTFELGDDLFNCQTCHASSMHLKCYENNNACGNSHCSKSEKAKPLHLEAKKVEGIVVSSGAETDEDMIDCIYCGEKIKRKALKCPYCKEYIDPKNDIKNKNKKKSFDEDDNLSVTEIILSILCGGIACIVGIIYVVQGKKKGWKMIGISFAAQVVFGIIQVLAGR